MKKLLQGLVIGIANIIPGVSGGTMMVAMGIYDKLIHSITHLRKEFKESMKFLIPVFAGVGIAIVVVARILEACFAMFPIQTNLLFCGLIVGSLPFIFKHVKGKSISVGMILSFLVFFGIVVVMAFMGESEGNGCKLWTCQCDKIIRCRRYCGSDHGSSGCQWFLSLIHI